MIETRPKKGRSNMEKRDGFARRALGRKRKATARSGAIKKGEKTAVAGGRAVTCSVAA